MWHSCFMTQKSQSAKIKNAFFINDLSRSTVLLVSSTKCVLRHPDSVSARENRDTVFCQMRRAIDLIHFVIREGISPVPDQNSDEIELLDMTSVSYQVLAFIHRFIHSFIAEQSPCVKFKLNLFNIQFVSNFPC